MKSSKQGSVLGASLVVALALTVVLAGLLKWTETESKLTRATALVAKADYVAEATGEFALAQINSRLQQSPVIVASAFTGAGSPPAAPDEQLLGSVNATFLKTMGIAGGGSSGSAGLIGDVISILGGLLGGGSGGSSGGEIAGGVETPPPVVDRFAPSTLNLTVGPFSAQRLQFIDPSNLLYADDPLRGQSVNVREVSVLSAAQVTDSVREEDAKAYCEHILQVRDTALFGFMLFYNLDLEIAPGAYMEVHGPVHTNRNLYATSGAGLNFHGVVTSAKEVLHNRAPGTSLSVASGDVTFKGAGGSQVSMQQSGSWLQSTSTNWTAKAMELWGGNLLSGTHGVTPTMPAAVPIYTPDDPATIDSELENSAHDLIEPAIPTSSASYTGSDAEIPKFASRACIVVEVTQNKNILGMPTNLTTKVYKYTEDSTGIYVRPTSTGSGTATFRRDELNEPSGLVKLRTFYDGRQAQTVYAADLDVSVLKTVIEDDGSASQWTNGAKTFAPSTEWNGIVYVEHKNPAINSSSLGAVRLINGQSLPNRPTAANNNAKGFTVASNASLYIKGNYNADGTLPASGTDIVAPESGEPPAAVAGDAVTILSQAWDDAKSTKGISDRKAQVTEVAAAVVAGIVPTNKNKNGTYSGGSENLLRFLENWSSVKLGYRGSMSVLFESESAKSPWPGTGSVYNAPNRIFGLNRLFVENTHPPGTPYARTFRRIGFRRLTLEEYNAAFTALGGS